MKRIIVFLLFAISLSAQVKQLGPMKVAGPTKQAFSPAITVEATCSGSSNTITVACSAPMAVTAGDVIACNGSVFGSDPMTLWFNDPINGMYDNIEGIVHGGSVNAWVADAVFVSSAGGSITPQVNTFEGPFEMHIKCRALKNTRTSLAVDGGAVNQTQGVTAANPTSGTAAAPTNNNEIVLGAMARSSTATVSDSAPWTPGGTITAVGTTGNYPLYDHYSIQSTAVTANSPMTATSIAFIDTQYAILNASNPSGYRAATGFYGVPAIAKTNAASVTAADLSGATTTLRNISTTGATAWVLSGSAATYDTSIIPSGTGNILVEGVGHAFGDAATSVKFSGAQTANFYEFDMRPAPGAPVWLSTFIRVGATGTSSGQICDNLFVYGGVTEFSFFMQTQFDNTDQLQFMIEPSEGGRSPWLTGFSLDTDYRIQVHIAGANERNHQLIVQSKSGGVWSIASTLNFDVLIATQGATGATTPTFAGHGTGSASSGSTSLTITSSAGSIVAGQVVYPTTGIDYLTAVESVTGTCSSSCTVVLSHNTTGVVSGTVNFIATPPTLLAATNGTASSGSASVTIVAPLSGTIVVGQAVGGVAGIANGTRVAAISGTSLTLSQPTSAAITNGGLWFMRSPDDNGGAVAEFGKWSSCTIGGSEWFSGMHFDPMGSWGAYLPN